MDEERSYVIKGSSENLDVLEQLLRHCEYLGNIGASRKILLWVDGDGDGRIKVFKVNNGNKEKINEEHYNTKQDKNGVVGIYDIE